MFSLSNSNPWLVYTTLWVGYNLSGLLCVSFILGLALEHSPFFPVCVSMSLSSCPAGSLCKYIIPDTNSFLLPTRQSASPGCQAVGGWGPIRCFHLNIIIKPCWADCGGGRRLIMHCELQTPTCHVIQNKSVHSGTCFTNNPSLWKWNQTYIF